MTFCNSAVPFFISKKSPDHSLLMTKERLQKNEKVPFFTCFPSYSGFFIFTTQIYKICLNLIFFVLFPCSTCCFLIRYNNGKEEKSNRFLSPTLETAAYIFFYVWSNEFISTCKIPGRNSRTRHQWKILIDNIAIHYMPIAWLRIIVHALGIITFHKTGKSHIPKRSLSYKKFFC